MSVNLQIVGGLLEIAGNAPEVDTVDAGIVIDNNLEKNQAAINAEVASNISSLETVIGEVNALLEGV